MVGKWEVGFQGCQTLEMGDLRRFCGFSCFAGLVDGL